MLSIPIQNANRYSCYNFGDKTQNPNDLPVHQTLEYEAANNGSSNNSSSAHNDQRLTYLVIGHVTADLTPTGIRLGVQQHFRVNGSGFRFKNRNTTACTGVEYSAH